MPLRKKGGIIMEAVKDLYSESAMEKAGCAGTDGSASLWGRRVELLDGEAHVLEYPALTHQYITGRLFTEIAVFLRAKAEACRVLVAPFAVFSGEDGRTCFQPDIAVVCNQGKLKEDGCHGAPDWVVEVTAPASRMHDYGKKLGAYINAGVREYWIVDPERQVIVTYCLERPDVPVIYRFGDVVKSSIFEGVEIESDLLREAVGDRTGVGSENPSPSSGDEDMDTLTDGGNMAPDPPRKMTSGEVREYIMDNFPELAAAGSRGPLMKAVTGALIGRADSSAVSEAVAGICCQRTGGSEEKQ